MSVTLTIDDAIARALRLPRVGLESTLKRELALALYGQGALSIGKSAELCAMPVLDFDGLVRERKIERPYSEDEIDQDLAWAERACRYARM